MLGLYVGERQYGSYYADGDDVIVRSGTSMLRVTPTQVVLTSGSDPPVILDRVTMHLALHTGDGAILVAPEQAQ